MVDDCFWSFEGCPEEDEKFVPITETEDTNAGDTEEPGFGIVIIPDGMVMPAGGSIAFLTVATFITALSYMRLFRWRKTVTGQASFY